MIRDATVADAPQLARIHIGSWQAAYAGLLPDDYLAGLGDELASRTARWEGVIGEGGPGAVVLVAESDQRAVVGFAHGGPNRDEDLDDRVGELYAMYLDPAVFRSGYGTRLLGDFVHRMQAAGYERLVLWVIAENRPARDFYEGNGWEFDGTEADQCLGLTVPAVRYRLAV